MSFLYDADLAVKHPFFRLVRDLVPVRMLIFFS
jgi:hypothetical protein